jgi:hypothetical protein
MVAWKPSCATRNEMNVPKNPLASWTQLVAMIRVPIWARFGSAGCIHFPDLVTRAYRAALVFVTKRSGR